MKNHWKAIIEEYIARKLMFYLVVLVAMGTSHCSVFSISALICCTVNCTMRVSGVLLTFNGLEGRNLRIPHKKKLLKDKIKSTSSLSWKDCNLNRKADLMLGGNPWYKASLVFGGTEPDRVT